MAPRVFVSYTHDSPEHKELVRAFAEFLRGQGIESVLDTWFTGERQDWGAWAIEEMITADFVIVVASPMYLRTGDGSGPNEEHKGVQSEAAILRDQLHGDRVGWRRKILPVVLPGRRVAEIPRFLQPHSAGRYLVRAFTTEGAEELLRVIHARPAHVAPPVAAPPDLPTNPPATPPVPDAESGAESESEARDGGGSVTNVVTGNITGTVLQARDIHGGVHLR